MKRLTFKYTAKLMRDEREKITPRLSQRALSKYLGYGKAQLINNIECNRQGLPFEQAPTLCKKLNLSKWVLLAAVLKDAKENFLQHFPDENVGG